MYPRSSFCTVVPFLYSRSGLSCRRSVFVPLFRFWGKGSICQNHPFANPEQSPSVEDEVVSALFMYQDPAPLQRISHPSDTYPALLGAPSSSSFHLSACFPYHSPAAMQLLSFSAIGCPSVIGCHRFLLPGQDTLGGAHLLKKALPLFHLSLQPPRSGYAGVLHPNPCQDVHNGGHEGRHTTLLGLTTSFTLKILRLLGGP